MLQAFSEGAGLEEATRSHRQGLLQKIQFGSIHCSAQSGGGVSWSHGEHTPHGFAVPSGCNAVPPFIPAFLNYRLLGDALWKSSLNIMYLLSCFAFSS